MIAYRDDYTCHHMSLHVITLHLTITRHTHLISFTRAMAASTRMPPLATQRTYNSPSRALFRSSIHKSLAHDHQMPHLASWQDG